MLEEPRAHDVGGVFGQNAALVLGRVVVVIEEVQVLVELQLELSGQACIQTPPCFLMSPTLRRCAILGYVDVHKYRGHTDG